MSLSQLSPNQQPFSDQLQIYLKVLLHQRSCQQYANNIFQHPIVLLPPDQGLAFVAHCQSSLQKRQQQLGSLQEHLNQPGSLHQSKVEKILSIMPKKIINYEVMAGIIMTVLSSVILAIANIIHPLHTSFCSQKNFRYGAS